MSYRLFQTVHYISMHPYFGAMLLLLYAIQLQHQLWVLLLQYSHTSNH